MAARKQQWQPDSIREKIKAGLLSKYLQDFVFGQRDMTPHQVTAAVALLRKCVPDLNATDLNVSGELVQRVISTAPLSDEEWQSTYGAGNNLASTVGPSESTH